MVYPVEETLAAIMNFFVEHLPDVLDLNLTASVVILFVICIRQLLKKAPKIFSYSLWGIVLLRLLVPVSIESPVSVIPEQTAFSAAVDINEVLPPIEWEDVSRNREIRESTPPGEPYVQTGTRVDPQAYLSIIWLAGMLYLSVRSLLAYLGLRERVKVAVPFRKGIFLADDIDTPFVMGFFRPAIYLPGSLDPKERKYIIAHERHHIRRGDHILKALGFLALTIHWFNPLVWVAFVLAGRDMEMSCDEAVIRKLGEDVRAEYSASLLNLATGKRMFTGTPLAFGEGDPTGRVRNLSKWKKPALWVILICLMICIVLAVCLLTDPESSETGPTLYCQYYTMDQQHQVMAGVITEDFGTGIVTATFVESSGPHAFSVELWHRGNENMPWEETEQQNIPLSGTAIFPVPAGNEYVVMATPMEGYNGYVTFDCKCQPGIHFADLDLDAVSSIELKNLHNGEYSFLRFQDEKNAICDFLKNLSGINAGSGKGYYEGTYQVRLLKDTEVLFSIGFGDSNSFHHGKGEDGYPVRYIPVGIDIKEIVAFLSKYDTSGFVWDFLKETQSDEQVAITSWNVAVKPDRVSRTGAAALFDYSGSIPGEEGAELTYGDFLSLDRAVDGEWVPMDELAGYEYYVGDASYPVVNGYGMVHEWKDRFGTLQDGQYRLGKLVTLTRPDGSREERMVYGEFSIPDSVLTGPIPLEDLPELYSGEQAMIDGCFVQIDGVARENMHLFQEFAYKTWNGEPSFIRIVNCHYGDKYQWEASDLTFDGSQYLVSSDTYSCSYRYLKRFIGEKAWADAEHDAYEIFVLVNDTSVTWQDISSGKLDEQDNGLAYLTVYSHFTYLPKRPQMPQDPAQAVLEFKGLPLVTTTDFDRLEKIWILFEEAELLGYEPKTHSIGVGLNLILQSQNGETMTIELDPDNDLARMNGEYVFYGAYDEPEYIFKLWEYLDIRQWPDIVYTECQNALRP